MLIITEVFKNIREGVSKNRREGDIINPDPLQDTHSRFDGLLLKPLCLGRLLHDKENFIKHEWVKEFLVRLWLKSYLIN